VNAYLRRYAPQGKPARTRRLAVAFLAFLLLVFAKVWESTVASSLSMERDKLRREVRALGNRVRLTSQLSERAALHEGIDPRSLESRGFVAPDPAHIVEIDLRTGMPRALKREGLTARLGSWIQERFHPETRPAQAPEGGEAVPVRAQVIP
jgi:hypothetical protein